MPNTRYHGSRGIVRMSTTGVANTAIVAMAKWSLDKSTDKVDVTSFGDTNKRSVQGLPSIKGTVSGFFEAEDSTMLTASESSTGTFLVLYPSSLMAGVYHYGPAWIDYKIDVDVNGAIKIDGSFEANGAWQHQP